MTFSYDIPNHTLAIRQTADNRYFVETFDLGKRMNFEFVGFFDDIESAERFIQSELIDENSQFDLDYSEIVFTDDPTYEIDSFFQIKIPFSVLDNSTVIKTAFDDNITYDQKLSSKFDD